jgi:formylglycine-generating enzyme required for sulfatase activity
MRPNLLLTPVLLLCADMSAAAPRAKIGEAFRDCRGCPEMVVLPSGTFLMGAPENEKGSSALERPLHRVHVPAVAVGRFDVTRDEWAAFVSATGRSTESGCAFTGRPGPLLDPKGSWSSLGFKQTGRDPVVCVTWRDASDYAAWLSKRTGKHYRLLSEAEWEYAARAGTNTPYYWGDTPDHKFANYGPDEAYGKGVATGRDKWIYTSPVGSFPPNRFGLYDMSGNVLQFVADCLGTYDKTPKDGRPYSRDIPLKFVGDLAELSGTQSCSYRVARGGDWGDPPEEVRSAFRNFAPGPKSTIETYRSGGLGFRVARGLSQ